MRLFTKKKRLLIFTLLIFIAGFCALPGLNGQSEKIEHDPLEYDVKVNAHIVPVFAVDKDGNPVHDLKENEIELYVNKKRVDLLSFTRFSVSEKAPGGPAVQKTEPAETPVEKPAAKEHSERIIFIIIDGVTNTKDGAKNSKKIAHGIIQAGKPGDAFIILTANIHRGFKYIIGPEKNKTLLAETLDKVYLDPRWLVYIPRANVTPLAGMGMRHNSGDVEFNATISRVRRNLSRADRMQYIGILTRFSYSLRDLKYALKTIRWPKMIYLISGGVREISGTGLNVSHGYTRKYYELLKESAIGINEGGALLYMINPIMIHRHARGVRNAAKYMSKIGNAKCIAGNNLPDILTKVKKNTEAYYELAFALTAKHKDRFNIKVKSKRKGIRLNTLRHGEKSKSYVQMNKTQKKLFALNVILGGSWSRVMGKISQARLNPVDPNTGKKKKIGVDVHIPAELQNKELDFFTLSVDPKTLEADIELVQKKAGSLSNVEVKLKKGRRHFVVVVEPGKARCIYNKVM